MEKNVLDISQLFQYLYYNENENNHNSGHFQVGWNLSL